MTEELLNYKQASSLLNIPISTLYALVSKEQIPFFRASKRIVRFSKSELETWLKAGGLRPHFDKCPKEAGGEK